MKEFNPNNEAIITNYPSPLKTPPEMSDNEKIDYIANRFKEIMEVLGLDLEDESLSRTPLRVARMYVNEVFSGLNEKNFPEMRYVENQQTSDEEPNMVFMKSNVTSFCEHHFVPMMGTAYVAYLPKRRLLGLSKIPRLVRFFSKRPQLQERLTAQIADSLRHILDTDDIAVSVVCQHFCIAARGIEDQSGTCTTQVLKGRFQTDPLIRADFQSSILKNQK